MSIDLSQLVIVENDKAVIQHWNTNHVDSLYDAVQESIESLKGHFWWANDNYSVEATKKFINDMRIAWLRKTVFSFGVFDPDDAHTVLGCVTLTLDNKIHRHGNIGYWIRESARRKGYCVEAVSNLIAFSGYNLFKESVFPVQRYQITAAVTNNASRNVAQRLGFDYEGTARSYLRINGVPVDAAIYSMIPEDE